MSVEALDEMGVKLLMCDYLEDVVDKWCELVSYDRGDKDVDEMLEIINTFMWGFMCPILSCAKKSPAQGWALYLYMLGGIDSNCYQKLVLALT
ncbi:hypothetical protein [Anaerobiospirillum succiniciproducens]|uniref:hypothetical protein n=1 Tax=Anaerobiospirillum succiniciproducens TaxID=13335 RepID=UPI00248F27A3|nr:hypothetical protein [Anaerobiospirillum succiniciproducens]